MRSFNVVTTKAPHWTVGEPTVGSTHL